MKRLLVYSLICFLSGIMLISCERVRASREEGTTTYQPRPAPVEEREATKEIKGELMGVDMKNNTISVRAGNGMEQTFRFSDKALVRDLVGKAGSEVTVAWKDEAGARVATSINVNQSVTRRPVRK